MQGKHRRSKTNEAEVVEQKGGPDQLGSSPDEVNLDDTLHLFMDDDSNST